MEKAILVASGTFCRVLGQYVREKKTLTLMEALRKMTLMPAKRLEGRVPAMKNKGRIRVGADADLTIFDPDRVIDKATFKEPTKYSEGIAYVFVNGVPVVKDGDCKWTSLLENPSGSYQMKLGDQENCGFVIVNFGSIQR